MIEDAPDVAKMFVASMNASDYRVELQKIQGYPFWDTGIEADIERFDPDLIILDLRLTRKQGLIREGRNEMTDSGFRILRHLISSERLRKKDIPVVVCSSFLDPSEKDLGEVDRRRALDSGAKAALRKNPFPTPVDFLRHARGWQKP
jgi:CheY-like chemotaxis protein